MRKPENETELTNLEKVLVTQLDVLNLDYIENSVKLGISKFGKIERKGREAFLLLSLSPRCR